MLFQLFFRLGPDIRLVAHGFPANLFMAELADSSPELPYLRANHASLFFWLHVKILPQNRDRLQPFGCVLVKELYLGWIFENHLQAKSWVVLNLPCELYVFPLIIRWIDLSLCETFHSRRENDSGERSP